VADDALERRIARLIARVRAPYSLITFASYPTAPEKSFALGIVCDGMSGLLRGDEAAVIAVSVFASRVIRWPSHPTPDRLRWAALAANQAVHKSLDGRGGTTLAAVMVGLRGAVVGVNAGDSRIYGLTRSRDVKQLSRDDNLAGLLGQPGGFGSNQLVQFIGMGDGIAPQIIDMDQDEFESILITSDGAHCASPATFAEALRAPTSNLDLIRRLLALNEALGGYDNGTALVLPTRFEAPDGDSEQGLNLTFWSPSDRLEIKDAEWQTPSTPGRAGALRRLVRKACDRAADVSHWPEMLFGGPKWRTRRWVRRALSRLSCGPTWG
jgi:serine/threonine protein phosphatase PrpC